MSYFYDYFAKEYRQRQRDRLFFSPAAMFWDISMEDVQGCGKALKYAFAGYREGKNAQVLKKFLAEYREYIAGLHDTHATDRYNAFVYRYMVERYVGSRAIATKLGVVKETVWNYIDKCIDEMLIFCMGMPAAVKHPGDKEGIVRMLAGGNRIVQNMAGEYVLLFFPGRRQRQAVERGREITGDVMRYFAEAVEAYLDYCRDEHTHIGTDIRKAGVLEKCLNGVPPAAIAEECGCSESTIYSDIRENERRLAAMLFDVERGAADAGF